MLGAYERGERAISVPRLERLAKFYNVPVDQLLPREDVTAPIEGDTAGTKLAVDLLKLSQLRGQPFEMLVRFLKMIQVQRQDFNGKVITVRGDDTRAIAAMLDVPVDQVGQRLDALDLLYRPDVADAAASTEPFGVYVHIPFCGTAATTARSPPGPIATT